MTTYYRLSKTFRTKSEAREALKRGEALQLAGRDGLLFPQASGVFSISGKLDHYKEWTGEARLERGVIKWIH